jgi:hypothetical protein
MADEQKPFVAIMVPSGRSWEADMAIAYGSIISYAEHRGVRTVLHNQKGSVVSFSRDDMAGIVDELPVTHLFWFDSDMVPPVDIITRLLAHEKDIVGCVYPRRAHPFDVLGHPLGAFDAVKGGCIPYWLLPGGCCLVTSKVYRTTPRPWYFNTERRPGEPLDAFFHLMDDLFCTALPNDVRDMFRESVRFNDWLKYESTMFDMRFNGFKRLGEDYNFLLKAQRLGFEVFCDLDASYELKHIGEQQVGLQRPEPAEEIAVNPETPPS